MQKQRPVYLDIHSIRLPIPGIASILHRLSGVILFVSIPIVLCLFGGTLSDAEKFQNYQNFVANPLVKIALIVLLWAFLHHALAGIRFLLLDAHKGIELKSARMSAKIVVIAAVVLAVVLGVVLW